MSGMFFSGVGVCFLYLRYRTDGRGGVGRRGHLVVGGLLARGRRGRGDLRIGDRGLLCLGRVSLSAGNRCCNTVVSLVAARECPWLSPYGLLVL
jgi:hypothetical protein